NRFRTLSTDYPADKFIENHKNLAGGECVPRADLKGHRVVHLSRDFTNFLRSKYVLPGFIGKELGQLGSCYKFDAREGLHVDHQVLEILEGPLTFLRRFHGRQLPLFAGRIGAVREVHSVPELPMDELTGMKIQADDPSTGQRHEPRIEGLKLALGVVQI